MMVYRVAPKCPAVFQWRGKPGGAVTAESRRWAGNDKELRRITTYRTTSHLGRKANSSGKAINMNSRRKKVGITITTA